MLALKMKTEVLFLIVDAEQSYECGFRVFSFSNLISFSFSIFPQVVRYGLNLKYPGEYLMSTSLQSNY